MKTYPLAVKELREFQGGHLGWWSKGHHDSLAFVAAIAALDLPHRIAIDSRAIRQEWWRCVPAPGEHVTCTFKAKAGARGAFPVTVVED